MAGRKRTPTNIKQVKGNPGKRALPKETVVVKSGIPTAPGWLSAKAKKAWPKVAALLNGMRVLTHNDAMALEALCEAYADLLSARESLAKPIKHNRKTIAKAGEITYVTVGRSGPMIRSRPEMALIADAERRLKSSLTDFGLTPAARSKVQALDDETQEKPEERFF